MKILKSSENLAVPGMALDHIVVLNLKTQYTYSYLRYMQLSLVRPKYLTSFA